MSRTSASPLNEPPETHGLVDGAQTRTDFILDTVTQAAEYAILDQRVFVLDETQWSGVIGMLDTPPRPNERLIALMARRPIWET